MRWTGHYERRSAFAVAVALTVFVSASEASSFRVGLTWSSCFCVSKCACLLRVAARARCMVSLA